MQGGWWVLSRLRWMIAWRTARRKGPVESHAAPFVTCGEKKHQSRQVTLCKQKTKSARPAAVETTLNLCIFFISSCHRGGLRKVYITFYNHSIDSGKPRPAQRPEPCSPSLLSLPYGFPAERPGRPPATGHHKQQTSLPRLRIHPSTTLSRNMKMPTETLPHAR